MKYFILGILFTIIVTPILESLTAVVIQYLEHIQTCIAVQTYKAKKDIEGEEGSEEQEEKHYGFYSCPEPQPLTVVQDEEEEE